MEGGDIMEFADPYLDNGTLTGGSTMRKTLSIFSYTSYPN